MATDDVTQIRIGGNLIGIAGLKAALETMVQNAGDRSDEEIAEELLKTLSGKNYIPEGAKKTYETAFLEEYRRFRDNPDQPTAAGENEVLLLGPGCANCDQLEREVREVMAELMIPGELILVRDPEEIGKWGVMGTPALVVRGRVVSVGNVPDRNQLKVYLADLGEGCETDRPD